MGRAAAIRGRPGGPAPRRRADLRRPGRRGRHRPSGALPEGAGRRRSDGQAQRGRAALGQPALRLERAQGRGLPLVDRTLPAHVRARRRRPDRPLPRLRGLLGGARAEQDGEKRTLAPRPRRGPLQRRRSCARASAARRRGSRRDHAQGGGAPRPARDPGDGGDAVRLRRPALELAPAREPPPAQRRLRRHARLRHGARLVEHALPPRAPGDRTAGSRAALGADRGSFFVPGRSRDRAGAGRARARQPSANEPSRDERGKLAVAPATGAADEAARGEAAGGNSRGLPPPGPHVAADRRLPSRHRTLTEPVRGRPRRWPKKRAMRTRPRPLLCELHAHTTWSDGNLAIAELVDLYGRSGFDVLAVTDHAIRADDPWPNRQAVRSDDFPRYLTAVESEARRARSLYDLLVLPGLELTYEDAEPRQAAHAVAVGRRRLPTRCGRPRAGPPTSTSWLHWSIGSSSSTGGSCSAGWQRPVCPRWRRGTSTRHRTLEAGRHCFRVCPRRRP